MSPIWKGSAFLVRLSNHISDIWRIIAFPVLAPALSMFSHTSPIHIESSPFGGPIAVIYHIFVILSTLHFPSTKPLVSMDGPSETPPPSTKTAVSVDGSFECLLPSMKSRLSVDGLSEKLRPSMKTAVSVDGMLVKEAGLSLRKQFFQNREVKP